MLINANTGQTYSMKNTAILLAAYASTYLDADPDKLNGKIVRVAGYKQWLDLGRIVQKGEHGTKVMMVCEKKGQDDNGDETRRKVCKSRTVFFEEQTKPTA